MTDRFALRARSEPVAWDSINFTYCLGRPKPLAMQCRLVAEDDMAELQITIVALAMLALRASALLLIVYVGTRLAIRHERRIL